MIDTPHPSAKAIEATQLSWKQRVAQSQTWVWAVGAIALLIGLSLSGAHTGFDRYVSDVRFSILSKPVSGDVVIVMVDQQTRNDLGTQSPSRSQHASVIDQIIQSGAKKIGFDFQLDLPAELVNDVALSRSLQNARGNVVLPVYSMRAPSFTSGTMYHTPIDTFTAHVDLGSIYLEPDADDMVRNFSLIQPWQDKFVPSFAAAVVGFPIAEQSKFAIDYSLQADQIPRFSYSDVLNGKVTSADLMDKYVFVGTTHNTVDSSYNVPLYGSLHGVELHALIAEALVQDQLIEEISHPATLAIAIGALVLLIGIFVKLAALPCAAIAIASALGIFGIGLIAQKTHLIAIPVALPLIAIAIAYVVGIFGRINTQSEDLFKRAFEARERGELMNAIISANFDGIVVLDEQDRVCLINPMAAQLLNWTVDAALGRERDAVMRLPDDISLVATDDGRSNIVETKIIRADGNELDVELTIAETALEPSNVRFERRKQPRKYRIFAFRDISERNEAEASMSEAAERAFQADRLKSEFIANMSHELRVPLNSIIGFSEVIKQELFGKLGSPHYKEYAQDIFASGTHLMSIIDDLLEVSKIASGKIEINDSVIDMERMFAECLQIVRGYPNASKKVLSASMRPGCPDLIADKRAMKQILINLLSNAIKFTNEGGGIRLSAAPSADGGVEVMVSDDGIGIPPEEMSRITEAFHQIDNPSHRKNAGTGLGLHIVQSLAELHGASVAVTSTVNSGTQVRVIFPADRNAPASNVISLEAEKNTG